MQNSSSDSRRVGTRYLRNVMVNIAAKSPSFQKESCLFFNFCSSAVNSLVSTACRCLQRSVYVWRCGINVTTYGTINMPSQYMRSFGSLYLYVYRLE